ncbi:MAG: hypothetical protein ACYDBQ_06360 [Thermoplasmatota archaeon]
MTSGHWQVSILQALDDQQLRRRPPETRELAEFILRRYATREECVRVGAPLRRLERDGRVTAAA